MEDLRFTPKKLGSLKPSEDPTQFDELAASMSDELWYKGHASGVYVETPDGLVSVARHVSYLVSPAFGDWHFGKGSEWLGRGSNHYAAYHIQPRPLGHVVSHETRKGRAERRIVSARLITPAPPKPVARRVKRAISIPSFGGVNGIALGNV